MRPEVLIYGTVVFIAFFSLHIIIWRIRIPQNDALYLIIILLALPMAVFLPSLAAIAPLKGFQSHEVFEAILLHVSFSLVYIASYPAAQAISPSLEILLIVQTSPERKMNLEEIIRRYSDTKLVVSRVEDLVSYSLIHQKGDSFELKPLARIFLMPFIAYRKLLGLPVGKG